MTRALRTDARLRGARLRAVLLVPAVLLAMVWTAGAFLLDPASATQSQDAALARRVCGTVPHELLLRVARGYFPGRSGQVQMIADEPNFVDGGLTHSGPWDYDQNVPLLLYGPGYVKPGVYSKPVTLADVAPTEAALLSFPQFQPPDGVPLTEALARGRQLPRLVVTLVWDSAGMDLLDRWPRSWPYLKSLSRHGAWFTHATAGASPSNTPVGHATIGTGSFPDHNGFADEYVYMNGRMQKPNENGPGFLLDPTLADLYDRANRNRPLVGVVATLSAHVMMMSHGSMWGGGDRDIAITREKEHAQTAGAEGVTWDLTSDMGPFYSVPGYANHVGNLKRWTDQLDRADGRIDGKWRQNDIAQLNNGFDTPARTPFQTELVKAIVQREGFGADDVPDLLDLNYKAIDTLGHAYSADGVELSDALKWQDRDLADLIAFLNRQVGKGRWVMALTADHGMNRDPNVTGAFRIGIDELTADIEQRFDGDGDNTSLLLKVRPTEIWLNQAELAGNGFTADQVAAYVDGLTQQDTVKAALAPAPDPSARVFTSAFPSSILSQLPCLPGGGA